MRLVVNADDFGMSSEKNIAIDAMMRGRVCTNASLVVNCPATEEAVAMAFAGGYQDRLSLHLNLTEGESLGKKIREHALYYAEEGFAHRPIIKSAWQVQPLYIEAVRQEIELQIRRFLSYGLSLHSLDSHNWVHLRTPVFLALRPLLRKYRISIVRPMWEGYKRPEIASARWSRYFRKFDFFLQRCPQCRVFGWTGNIEQFLLARQRIEDGAYVEVFTHPAAVDGEIMDLSSSYCHNPRKKVVEWVRMLASYEKISIMQILEENGI